MISLTWQAWLLLYLLFFLTYILSLWIWNHYQQKKKVTLPALYDLTICEYCHYPYLSLTTKPINQCPQCESFNNSSFQKDEL